MSKVQVVEEELMKPFTVRLVTGRYEQLRTHRHETGQSYQDTINAALEAYFAPDAKTAKAARDPLAAVNRDEREMLNSCLALLRRGGEACAILKAVLRNWERLAA